MQMQTATVYHMAADGNDGLSMSRARAVNDSGGGVAGCGRVLRCPDPEMVVCCG